MTERPLGVRQMDWEHRATVNRPATSQQVPVRQWPRVSTVYAGATDGDTSKGNPLAST